MQDHAACGADRAKGWNTVATTLGYELVPIEEYIKRNSEEMYSDVFDRTFGQLDAEVWNEAINEQRSGLSMIEALGVFLKDEPSEEEYTPQSNI